MKLMSSLRIGPRLGVGFGITLIALLMIGGLAALQVSRVYSGTTEIADNRLPSVQTLGEMRALANAVRRASLRSVLESNSTKKQDQRARHDEALADLNAELSDYRKRVASDEELKVFSNLKQAWSTYMDSDKRLLILSEQGDATFQDARALSTGESARLFTEALRLIEQDVRLNREAASVASTNAATNYHTTIVLTSTLIGAALVLCTVVAWLTTRSIVLPISQAVHIAQTVAQGDLTSEIEVLGKDETSHLLRALKDMNERLVDMVSRVRSSSEAIATGAAQIATGNTDLSSRTEEQAASLEQTASSMEELTATVKQNAENARQGNSLANNASEIAVRGGDAVRKVVETMHDISSGSTKVAEIISVIESIAFQTNILALNAAVEAARAGEQGRGFAVVASEVRSLAQRSATAAKEIKELIDHSVAQVQAGTNLVDDASTTMKGVVQSVKRVTDLMGEISSASVEQHTGIEQVNQAVIQMDGVTQQNAALVEEASAAAQSLAAQSTTLRELVAVFRLPASGWAQARPVEAQRLAPIAKSFIRDDQHSTRPTPKAQAESVASTAADWQTF